MKLSTWNSYINLRDNSGIIYNAFTDNFIVVKSNSMDLVYAQRGEIKNFSPLFIEQMLLLGGLVDEALDEAHEIDKIISSIDLDKSNLHVIVNPTLDCNFNCWYCYESHVKGSCMSQEIQKRLITLIEKRLNNEETNKCQLSFFGGEPLLKFREVIHPIVSKVAKICNQRGVSLSLQFTTNASILNDEIIDFLKCFTTSFQITLDGGRTEHNKIRFDKGNIPSYDLILTNINRLAHAGFQVICRVNYTSKNIESCKDIPLDLNRICNANKNNIVVDFQRVWQDASASFEDNTDILANNLRSTLRLMKFKTSNNRLNNSLKNPCYADNINELLVNYNGDVFFCTARDFNFQDRTGFLQENGEIEWINDNYVKRMSCKFTKQICRTCRIAPICGGGCRTKCIENASHDKCNIGFTEEDIDNLILDKFINRYM